MKKKFLWKKSRGPIIPLVDLMSDDDEDDFGDSKVDKPDFGPNFEFYTLQTNFKLNPQMLETIAELPGIEKIEPISQYQLLIGLPNSGFFDIEKVKKDIELSISAIDNDIINELGFQVETLYDTKTSKNFYEIINGLQNSKDMWLLYLYPNGEFEIMADINNQEDFTAKLTKFSILQELVGGFLVSSLVFSSPGEI